MKHTFKPIGEKAFDFWGQIRKEYEEMAEKHNKAVEKGEHLNCSCRADWNERIRNHQLIHEMVSKLVK